MRDRKAGPRPPRQAGKLLDGMKAEIARPNAEPKRATEERNTLRKAAVKFPMASRSAAAIVRIRRQRSRTAAGIGSI